MAQFTRPRECTPIGLLRNLMNGNNENIAKKKEWYTLAQHSEWHATGNNSNKGEQKVEKQMGKEKIRE